MRLQHLLMGLCTLAPAAALAQWVPTKPIRLVIGSVPGGGNDLVGRLLAHKLSESLRQQVVVDNRGGANGIIGMDLVAKAAPDGYTFFMGTAGHLSVNPALYPEMPLNPEIRQKLAGLGFDPVGSTPGEFGAFRSAEEARWARVIKEANIRAE